MGRRCLPLSSSILTHSSHIGDPYPPYCRARGQNPPMSPPQTNSAKGKNAHISTYPNGSLAPGSIHKEKLA